VIGRPFVTSPGVPAERVAILRKAFDEMLKDPAFLEDSTKSGIDISPVDGVRIQKIVADFMNTPAGIVTKAKLAMEPKDITERTK
jgi:tripartite-type tricarboxylate transporter receptor subunit TctC